LNDKNIVYSIILLLMLTNDARSHDHGVYSISCFCTVGHLIVAINFLTVELEIFLVSVKCFFIGGKYPALGH
jgi:hypothetical protein